LIRPAAGRGRKAARVSERSRNDRGEGAEAADRVGVSGLHLLGKVGKLDAVAFDVVSSVVLELADVSRAVLVERVKDHLLSRHL
jgi:hypothetical protein